jgi:hypothetical protein
MIWNEICLKIISLDAFNIGNEKNLFRNYPAVFGLLE